MNQFQAECSDCYVRRLDERDDQRLQVAEEVPWDGECFVYSHRVSGSHDGWFPSPDELAERAVEDGLDVPEFAFASSKCKSKLDLDLAIECMLDDTHEDAEIRNPQAVDELRRHVDKFNEENAVIYFMPDQKRKVRIRK